MNGGVEHQALVLDVIEIVLELLPRIFNRSAIGILDLRPTGQARRDQVSLFVISNLLGKLRDKVRALGTRTDEIHVAAQDVPELRNLVDANLANDPADTSGMRSSPLLAQTGPSFSASTRIERNFINVKVRRSCRRVPVCRGSGPGESILIRSAVRRAIGKDRIAPIKATSR